MKEIVSAKLLIFIFFLFIASIISVLIYRRSSRNVVINIYYTGNNGSAIKFAEEMEASGLVDAIRNEDGNLKYEYFYPKNDRETVLLIDIWKNQKALDLHHNTPMMKRIAELRVKYDLHMNVEKYSSHKRNFLTFDEKFIRR